jgi:putative heme-binding domain-containing protein
VASGGVDATAVTLDNEGNLYFGLLVADYSNAYRLRKRKDLKPEERAWLEARGGRAGDPEEEVSLYDIHSKRGTIQKWNQSTRTLETIATGIRVPYSLAFNRHGDLFNTDQEGETWMPNGNPLDELNHIIPGRNYGFPPQHEKWLPNLVSQSPVVAFGPQHESTCGLVFNEPHGPLHARPLSRTGSKHKAGESSALPCSPGQGLFGPQWWEDDAFVAGESRGKIWRVRLVKTPYGYVGKEFLVARLSMLTMDLAISPKGDLYVCCHSGLPDWGTGPSGEGKIFKITYTDPKAPQPVIAWAASPTEARIAFDKPLDSSVTNSVLGREIQFGEHVRAGDRYEVLKPPYQVVKLQEATPRGRLKITAAKLEHNQQTLVLTTDPHPQQAKFALSIPGVKAWAAKSADATVDVEYDLHGVEAQWTKNRRDGTRREWSGWLPHFDWDISRRMVAPSLTHEMLRLQSLASAGVLHLRARIDAADGTNSIRFTNSRFDEPIRWAVEPEETESNRPSNRSAVSQRSQPLLVSAEVPCAYDAGPRGHFYFVSGNGSELRSPPLATFVLPWAPVHSAQLIAPPARANLAGGDYERGRSLFFGDQLKCSTCHRLRGEGGLIGPDLSNLASRDAASVLRDIKEPNASINPDYVAYNVILNNGTERTGFIRAPENTVIQLLGADGQETRFRPTDVKELRVSSISLMPAGLLDALKEEQVDDLLTFLLNAPPKRSPAEVEAVLTTGSRPPSPLANRSLTIALVASKQDHGPGQHDYPSWQQTWLNLLTAAATNVTVATAWEWPTEEQFKSADVIVFYFWNHDWNAGRYGQLDQFLGRGGGVVLFHSATIADTEPKLLAERMGLASQPQRTKYLHTPLDLKIVAPPDHPITVGLPRQIHFLDEPYWPMIGDATKIQVLATTNVEGEDRPMMWTFQKGPGRVFGSILGHYTWTHEDPLFRLIALRSLAWAAGEPAGRFDELALNRRSVER